MASRDWHSDQCPGIGHIEIDCTLIPQGAGNPTGGEGTAGNFLKNFTRVSAGLYRLTTVDRYVAVVAQSFQIVLAAMVGTWTLQPGAPVQNADGTWTLTFTAYLSGAATDVPAAAGNSISCYMRFRNSTLTP